MEIEEIIKKIMDYNPRSPYFKTRISRKPDMIILHTVHENFESYYKHTAEDILKIYTDIKSPSAYLELSPHYLIKDDAMLVNGNLYATIINTVNPNNVAHHAGKSRWKDETKLNENSLGIEIMGYTNKNLTKAQYNSLYALVQFLIEKYDIPINRILGHYQVSPERRTDPGEKIMKNVLDEMVNRLHKDSLIIDAHQDTILSVIDLGKDISVETDLYEVDIPRMRKGNLDIAFFALFTGKSYRNKGKRLRQLLRCFEKTMKDNSKILTQVTNLEDINSLEDKLGIVLSIENAAGIDGYVSLDELYKSGVRCLSLTHNPQNRYATGLDGKTNRGVTKKGKELIKKMNDLGVIIDVSHLNEKSFWDVMKCSEQPVVATHSNCYGIKHHRRNLKDYPIKELAKKGGVIGINFWAELLEKKNIKGVVDNVDYIKNLVGIDHVGLGTDYDGIVGDAPKGLEDVSKLKNLTKELVKRGYTNSEVRKVLGLNFVRVFEKVWK